MITPTKLVTAEELLQVPEEGRRCDLFRGELVWTSCNTARNGAAAARLAMHLGNHIAAHDLGTGLVGCGFILDRDPDTVLGPDVAFLRKHRLYPYEGDDCERYVPGPPDLAVEFVCPDDPASYVLAKIVAYLDAATPLLWVVEAGPKVVLEWRASGGFRVLRAEDVLDGGDVVPGFRLAVPKVFGYPCAAWSSDDESRARR